MDRQPSGLRRGELAQRAEQEADRGRRDRIHERIVHYTPERISPFNEAMRAHPRARETERRLLIDRLDLRPGLTVVDTMAGGGFLAEGIRRRAGPGARILCIDPAASFTDSIDRALLRVTGALGALPLATASVDRVANLAGLHHLELKADFVREAHRVLRPGGRLAVADVLAGSPPARWLNGPVDRWTDIGHDGMFPAEGELRTLLERAGFADVGEDWCEYTWDFPTPAAMAWFCKRLFRLFAADEARVEAELRRTLKVETSHARTTLAWSLVYAVGTKPTG